MHIEYSNGVANKKVLLIGLKYTQRLNMLGLKPHTDIKYLIFCFIVLAMLLSIQHI